MSVYFVAFKLFHNLDLKLKNTHPYITHSTYSHFSPRCQCLESFLVLYFNQHIIKKKKTEKKDIRIGISPL